MDQFYGFSEPWHQGRLTIIWDADVPVGERRAHVKVYIHADEAESPIRRVMTVVDTDMADHDRYPALGEPEHVLPVHELRPQWVRLWTTVRATESLTRQPGEGTSRRKHAYHLWFGQPFAIGFANWQDNRLSVRLRADLLVEDRRFKAELRRFGDFDKAGRGIPVTVYADDNRYKELVVQDTLTEEELTEDRLLTLAEKVVRYAVEEGF